MNLDFLRHADALVGMADEVRPLSPQGRVEARALGQFLKRAGVRFDRAYCSPLLRARQTAELVLAGGDGPVGGALVEDALRNETSQDVFERWLTSLEGVHHALLVGHAPTLAARVRKLLGFDRDNTLELSTGGLVCVTMMGKNRARLVFFVSPAWLGKGD